MHLLDPIPEAVYDHPADDGLIGVQRISGAAVIGIARTILIENVISAVVQATETQSWAVMVTFGGVVEHNVENHLYTCPVQRLNHVAELVQRTERVLARAVRLVRRKE
jgi:hypothetical protein